jgi:hypothetical protein
LPSQYADKIKKTSRSLKVLQVTQNMFVNFDGHYDRLVSFVCIVSRLDDGSIPVPLYPEWLQGLSLQFSWYWGGLSPAVKWSGYEADHSPPSSVEVRNV